MRNNKGLKKASARQQETQEGSKTFSAALLKWIRELELQNRLDEKSTLEITTSELKRMFSEADVNNDGFVDREEFRSLVASFQESLSKASIKQNLDN